MKHLGVGILGCGKMGKIYANYFNKNPQSRIVGLYNQTMSRAEELASNYERVKVYKEWEDLVLTDEIDIIGICTPSHEHMEQMKLSLENNKHVLCEKPMARNVNESREMVILSQNSKAKVMIGFQMRFHPVIGKIDELIETIGDIYHVDFVFGMLRPEIGWRHRIIQQGGVLKELASHLLDLALHWCGTVFATTAVNRIIHPEREVEDYSLNIFEFKSGATGYLFSNYYDRRDRVIKGNILGKKGQIEWQFSSYDPKDSRVTMFTDRRYEISINIPSEIDSIYPGHLDSFKKEIDHFVDCIIYDKEPIVGSKEGTEVMEIIDASYESQRSDKKIKLPLKYFSTDNIELCFKKRGTYDTWERS